MHARISVAKLISRLRFELGRLGGRETEAMPRQTKNSMRIYIAKLDLLVYGCGYTKILSDRGAAARMGANSTAIMAKAKLVVDL